VPPGATCSYEGERLQNPAKATVITLVSLVTLAFGIAPAHALPLQPQTPELAAVQPATVTQNFNASDNSIETQSLDTLLEMSEYGKAPHNFDVEAAIAQARSEVGTSRPTGWSAPGECIMSVIRWVADVGGANWVGNGNPVDNYIGATRLSIEHAQPGDVVQYEHLLHPTSWVSGVHTLLITETNGDGTFGIVQSNIPGGSGLVTEVTDWVPEPPAGFQAVVWRF
jgi:hypothetical protein